MAEIAAAAEGNETIEIKMFKAVTAYLKLTQKFTMSTVVLCNDTSEFQLVAYSLGSITEEQINAIAFF